MTSSAESAPKNVAKVDTALKSSRAESVRKRRSSPVPRGKGGRRLTRLVVGSDDDDDDIEDV